MSDRKGVEARIKLAIETALLADSKGGWITYLVRDPSRPDLKGNAAGWPIYVGQTDELGRRVRNHLGKSEKLARRGRGIKQRMKELLHAGALPNFEVLDRQPTRLASLLSETNFAGRCRTRGYDIANATILQNRAGPPVTARELPKKWLWRFTLEQAMEDALVLEVKCRSCSSSVQVDPWPFAHLADRPSTLGDVRDRCADLAAACDECGEIAPRQVLVRVP